jgi:hypothetical protein
MGFNNAFFLFIFLKKLNQLFSKKQDLPNIIDLPAPVSPVIIENPFEKSMLNFLLTFFIDKVVIIDDIFYIKI